LEINKMRFPSLRLAAAAALATVALSAPTHAAEWEYLSRFSGSFSGSGLVQRNAAENPNKVTCTLSGQPSKTGVSMSGKCGAFIFSRNIRADIRYDAASGRYTGVYEGSAIGPARLSGKRQGDAVVLTITWPKPVNGDTKAVMTIRNDGNGRLAITVTDKVAPGGPTAKVTQLALNQS
jgi:hypothetical protein